MAVAEAEKIAPGKGRSPWYYARKRFLSNKAAVGGLIYLCLCTLIAIFAYLIIPDDTENANMQVLELAKEPPGTKAMLLHIPLKSDIEEKAAIVRWFTGRNSNTQPIAIDENTIRFQEEKLFFNRISGASDSVNIAKTFLHIDEQHPFTKENRTATGLPYMITDGSLVYIDQEGSEKRISMMELQEKVKDEYLDSFTYWFGTDGYGRDILSRLILGTRVSLAVGFIAVLISLLLGLFLGAIAGFFRGWVDDVAMWFISVVWSLPTLLLAVSLSFAMGKGFWQVFLAIGLSMWVEVARIVRGQIFAVREYEYVQATRALGFKVPRVITKHILPNIMGPVIIVSAANFAAAILIEAGLSFLGIGVKPPTPTWGGMINEGYTYLIFESGKWLAIFPGLAIILVVVSLNLVGFGLRDALDPKYDFRT